ncbi:SGNH/GDSL hydrolase family protein [Dermacoccus sp. Tok2021]|uniref:SGNH/GDSL hydrolase family protein n=1 Tax=Dermacoccus sp. Tok2021 TaxID=2826873 RepID=UPI001CEC664C|nr:SGNH/GDSL hydrolase family protein [Dermacoccus sp. Tok2021]MBZ4497686.1 SGNH/GDSL hydrolase family protein [Dermacoccus sp. Tok2021]
MNGRFVAVGDSFTEGVGDANLMYPNGVRGWADRMARQLGKADSSWEYANFAIRSKRLDEIVDEQFDAALALNPTLISFYAGGNDILAVRADMRSIMDRYESALDRLVSSGADVMLFTTFDVKISTALEPLRRRIVYYNDAVRTLAARYGCLLIDHTQYREFEDRRMWAFDRIHMSKVGHKHLAAYVLGELGVPHTLKLPELGPFESPDWRETLRTEGRWLASEVVPLMRRRMNGVREGDTLPPKWPDPIRPADGMKRLARARSGDAMEVHERAAHVA